MESKQYENILNELKIIRKLLAANLYAFGVDSEDVGNISGMNSTDIRKLLSKRKIKGEVNAKKS